MRFRGPKIALVATLSLCGCVHWQYGDPPPRAPESIDLNHPIVSFGSTDLSRLPTWGDGFRQSWASTVISEMESELGRYSAADSLDVEADSRQLAFTQFTPGDVGSYDRVARSLPPHYLSRFVLQADQHLQGISWFSSIMTGLTLGAWGFLPGFGVDVSTDCGWNVYGVASTQERHLLRDNSHYKKSVFGNAWWYFFSRRSALQTAYRETVLACLDDIGGETAREISRLEQANSALVEFDSVAERNKSPRGDTVQARPSGRFAGAIAATVSIDTDEGSGSGFYVSGDGLIVTNYHVVGESKYVTVLDGSHGEIPGRVLARDALRDLAIVKVGIEVGAVLALGARATVGDDVVAIGAPLGLQHTVTKGIVSATRMIDGEVSIVQTDASISPGSSGGPIVHIESGYVIGIATFKISQDSGEGLGFAVSAEEVREAFGAFLD